MQRMIFINLSVADVAVATAFYTGLGFRLDTRFSDRLCSCLRVSDTICVMALQTERFADFLTGPPADPQSGAAVIHCLSAGSRSEVDELVDRALHHGGTPWLEAMSDGPLYGHSFADPDGHVWEVLHMEPTG